MEVDRWWIPHRGRLVVPIADHLPGAGCRAPGTRHLRSEADDVLQGEEHSPLGSEGLGATQLSAQESHMTVQKGFLLYTLQLFQTWVHGHTTHLGTAR